MRLNNCLIGYNGFVGSNLKNSELLKFDDLYNSSNIIDISNKEYGLVVCAAPSATKWKINKDPMTDLYNIVNLSNILKTVKAERFVLLSTIDIYDKPDYPWLEGHDVRFNSPEYGQNRCLFEKLTLHIFKEKAKIVRLPALYGNGLKKNIIFDLMNDNMIENISLETQFQWYNVSDLEKDINKVIQSEEKIYNLFPEPVLTKEIVKKYFASKIERCRGTYNKVYRVKTKHSNTGYIYNKDTVLNKMGSFLER